MLTISRIKVAVALLAGALACVALPLWYLSYQRNPRPSGAVNVAGLAEAVTLGWGVEGDVQIRAANMQDAVLALGYAHGWNHAWNVVLWRQAALGRLALMFGDDAVSIDRLMRLLGIEARARSALQELPPQDLRYLEAYAAGLNAALTDAKLPLRRDFLQYGVVPEPWEAWHTLAIERLFAWLAVPERDLEASAPAFIVAADNALRNWLHVHGFEHSLAWIYGDGDNRTFFWRFVYGNTALPAMQELEITTGPEHFVRGASIPGTPFLPFGITADGAWAFFPSARVSFGRAPETPDAGKFSHERIVSASGREFIQPTETAGIRVVVPAYGGSPTRTLFWSGFTATSDVAAWRSLQSGGTPAFELLDGIGLRAARSGEWTALGSPALIRLPGNGVLVGPSPASAYVAEFLGEQQEIGIESWLNEAHSSWAARIAPLLLQAVAAEGDFSPGLRSALSYLQNWDFTYGGASIAPSILEAWIRQLPESPAWSAVAEDALRAAVADTLAVRRALEYAVQGLERQLGADQSQWRWERLHADRRYFPYPSGRRGPWLAAMQWPGHGHRTSLAWNPAPKVTAPVPSAAWEAWHRADSWGSVTVRERSIDPHDFLGIHRAPDLLTPGLLLSEIRHTTDLEP